MIAMPEPPDLDGVEHRATSTTAATAVSAIDTSTHACVNEPIATAVAIPRSGTARPTTA